MLTVTTVPAPTLVRVKKVSRVMVSNVKMLMSVPKVNATKMLIVLMLLDSILAHATQE